MPSPNGAEGEVCYTCYMALLRSFFFLHPYLSAGVLRLSVINLWCYAPIAAACRPLRRRNTLNPAEFYGDTTSI